MQSIKQSLQQLCREYLITKIDQTEKAMEEAQLAANNETKSSAGDKHETGRAMMQLEIEKYSKQLTEWLKTLKILDNIDAAKPCRIVSAGALVFCSSGNYYISVAAGKLKYEGQNYYAISAASPIGALLMGQTVGGTVEFREQRIVVNEVY